MTGGCRQVGEGERESGKDRGREGVRNDVRLSCTADNRLFVYTVKEAPCTVPPQTIYTGCAV
jgi:hypothetical protein